MFPRFRRFRHIHPRQFVRGYAPWIFGRAAEGVAGSGEIGMRCDGAGGAAADDAVTVAVDAAGDAAALDRGRAAVAACLQRRALAEHIMQVDVSKGVQEWLLDGGILATNEMQ
jgi:hypothetical protein